MLLLGVHIPTDHKPAFSSCLTSSFQAIDALPDHQDFRQPGLGKAHQIRFPMLARDVDIARLLTDGSAAHAEDRCNQTVCVGPKCTFNSWAQLRGEDLSFVLEGLKQHKPGQWCAVDLREN